MANVGEAKRRRGEIERLRREDVEWRASLTPEQAVAAEVARKVHERIVAPLQLSEACYQLAMFAHQYLSEKHQVASEVVIGWVNGGQWEGVASHAWTEVGGRKIDLSLTHTTNPHAVPRGGLLILDRLMTKGDAVYTYHREAPQEAMDYLRRQAIMDPTFMRTMVHKEEQHQNMRQIATDPELIRQYLDQAPAPIRYIELVKLMDKCP